MRTLIRNATAVLPRTIERTNVLVDGARIAAVDAAAHAAADEVVEADGLVLMPGVIDAHVHMRDPGLTHKEDLYSGSRACAAGGVTSFLDMPNTIPATTSQARLEAKLALAARKSVVNYGFFLGATADNAPELRVAHRTPGIKVFIGSSTGDLLVDGDDALERLFSTGALPICGHCEDETALRANRARIGEPAGVRDHSRIRDAEVARVATERGARLARAHGRRFHVAHLSTAGEVEAIRDHHGLLTAEVCPHHLFLSIADYDRLGTRAQMNPPLRPSGDVERVWSALLEDRVQMIATDHAPHTLAEKALAYPRSPSGVPAVENALALMLDAVYHGRISLRRVVDAMCDAPARVWDMVGKGRLEVGGDADLVLVDPNLQRTVRNGEQVTRCGWSPWDGMTLRGWPVSTWVMGHRVFREGRLAEDGFRGAEIRFDHARGGYWATA